MNCITATSPLEMMPAWGLFEKGHHKGQKLELALTNKFNT